MESICLEPLLGTDRVGDLYFKPCLDSISEMLFWVHPKARGTGFLGLPFLIEAPQGYYSLTVTQNVISNFLC